MLESAKVSGGEVLFVEHCFDEAIMIGTDRRATRRVKNSLDVLSAEGVDNLNHRRYDAPECVSFRLMLGVGQAALDVVVNLEGIAESRLRSAVVALLGLSIASAFVPPPLRVARARGAVRMVEDDSLRNVHDDALREALREEDWVWFQDVAVPDVAVQAPLPETAADAFGDVVVGEAAEEVEAMLPQKKRTRANKNKKAAKKPKAAKMPAKEPAMPASAAFETPAPPALETPAPPAFEMPEMPAPPAFEWKADWTETFTEGIAKAIVAVEGATKTVSETKEELAIDEMGEKAKGAFDTLADGATKTADAVSGAGKFAQENDLAYKGIAIFQVLGEEMAKATKKAPPKPVEPPPPPPKPKPFAFMPKVAMPKGMAMPKVEVPKVQLPKVEVPKVTMPKVQLPKMAMPKKAAPADKANKAKAAKPPAKKGFTMPDFKLPF